MIAAPLPLKVWDHYKGPAPYGIERPEKLALCKKFGKAMASVNSAISKTRKVRSRDDLFPRRRARRLNEQQKRMLFLHWACGPNGPTAHKRLTSGHASGRIWCV